MKDASTLLSNITCDFSRFVRHAVLGSAIPSGPPTSGHPPPVKCGAPERDGLRTLRLRVISSVRPRWHHFVSSAPIFILRRLHAWLPNTIGRPASWLSPRLKTSASHTPPPHSHLRHSDILLRVGTTAPQLGCVCQRGWGVGCTVPNQTVFAGNDWGSVAWLMLPRRGHLVRRRWVNSSRNHRQIHLHPG